MLGRSLAHLPEPVRHALRVARLRPFDTSTAAGRSDERYRRIVLSMFASVVGRGITTAASLVSIPVAIGYLGKERYGLWATINALTPWLALADLGIVAAIVNPLAEANGRDDQGAARRHLATALALLTGAAAVLSTLAVVGYFHLPWQHILDGAGALPARSVRASATVAFLLAATALPLGVVPQVFAAYQKSYVSTAIVTAGALLSLGALLLCVAAQAPLHVFIAAANGGAVVASAAGLAYLYGRSMPWLRPGRVDVSSQSRRRILASSVPLYLFQVGALLVNQSQAFILARRVGLSTVAEFDLLFKVYALATGLVTMSTAGFAPSFRDAHERGETAWMRRSFWHLVKVRLAAAAVGCLALALGGNAVFRLWLRRTDFHYDPGVWIALAALILVALWSSSFLELMTVLDRIWPQVGLVLAQGAVTVLLTWTLSPRFGVLGALIAMTLPAFALTGLVLPWGTRRYLREPKAPPR